MSVSLKFLKDILEPGELVITDRRLHWIYAATGWVWFFALTGLGWGAALAARRYFGDELLFYEVDAGSLSFVMQPEIVAWLFTAVGALLLLMEYVARWTTLVVLTSKRLIRKTGLVNIRIDETDVSEIKAVHVNQGWLGWIFGYGRINMDCRFVGDISIPYLPRPYQFVKALHKMRTQVQSRDGGDFDDDGAARAAAIRVLPVYIAQPGGRIVQHEHTHLLPDDEAAKHRLGQALLIAFRKKS